MERNTGGAEQQDRREEDQGSDFEPRVTERSQGVSLRRKTSIPSLP